MIYIRNYTTGETISGTLQCPFYKARADNKGELLQEWIRNWDWIVATGVLGTGINIKDIIFVIHINRLYGLTSFAQQSGRGERGKEISNSIIIIQVKTTSGHYRKKVLSEYYIKQVDEEAMMEFLQVKGCRYQVIIKHFNSEIEGVNCRNTDSILYNWCIMGLHRPRALGQEHEEITDKYRNEIDSKIG